MATITSTERAVTTARCGLARTGNTRCGAVMENPVLLTPSAPESGPNDIYTKVVGGSGDNEPGTSWSDVQP